MGKTLYNSLFNKFAMIPNAEHVEFNYKLLENADEQGLSNSNGYKYKSGDKRTITKVRNFIKIYYILMRIYGI